MLRIKLVTKAHVRPVHTMLVRALSPESMERRVAENIRDYFPDYPRKDWCVIDVQETDEKSNL